MLSTPEIMASVEPGKSELRRRAILDVARDIFLAQGFAATSMSEIATRLGGSKGTLYNYFRSKEELFEAIMIDTSQGPANAVFDHLPPIDGDLRKGLENLGLGLLGFILSNASLAVNRIVVAESDRFPELGRIFYEAGPLRGQERLDAYFRKLVDTGQIRSCDPGVAGRRFKDLILSDLHSRRLWGVLTELTPEQLHAHVQESVDIFLAAFGAER
jgi:AcrR family transcriptional regulator